MRLAIIALICIASQAKAGIIYDILPTGPNGLAFSPSGGDLVATDLLLAGPTPLYLDMGVAFLGASPGGIAYRPASDRLQLFVLSVPLPGTVSSVVEHGLLLDDARALPRGPGLWEFTASLAMVGATPDVFDLPGSVRLLFDVARPLGHQVEGGVLIVGSVPEPSTAVLILTGAALAVAAYFLTRKGA